MLLVGYVLTVIAQNLVTVVDAATYYIGCKAAAPTTTALANRIFVPKPGTIKAAYVEWEAATAGTSENISVYIRLNNTTDTLIATIGNANQSKLFSNTSLNIPVVQGDYFEIKIVCPTWVTNPANLTLGGQVYIE